MSSLEPANPPASSSGGSATSGEPITPIVMGAPTGAPTRSPGLLLGVAITALVLLVVNIAGSIGFPYNAPVESIFAIGITIDLLAIAVVCGLGAWIARRGYPLRGSSIVTILAVAFAAGAVVLWLVSGGVVAIAQLLDPGARGRYMYATGGLFLGGALWVLATVFGAHGYRRGGARRNNRFALAALAATGVLAAFAVASSVLYGLGLTD